MAVIIVERVVCIVVEFWLALRGRQAARVRGRRSRRAAANGLGVGKLMRIRAD